MKFDTPGPWLAAAGLAASFGIYTLLSRPRPPVHDPGPDVTIVRGVDNVGIVTVAGYGELEEVAGGEVRLRDPGFVRFDVPGSKQLSVSAGAVYIVAPEGGVFDVAHVDGRVHVTAQQGAIGLEEDGKRVVLRAGESWPK